MKKKTLSHELCFIFLAYALILSLPSGWRQKSHQLKENIFEKGKYLRRIAVNLQIFIGLCIQQLNHFMNFSFFSHAAAAKSRQLCPTLCDPIDGSPPGSRPWDSPGKNTGVCCHFLLQCMKVKSESEVTQLCVDQQTVAYQAPPSMGFPMQEYWIFS